MPLRFPMLLGAHRDTVELNYVASLLQTTSDKSYRADGTVTALDVRRYLTSRHGFRVDTKILEREILHTLVGTRNRNNNNTINSKNRHAADHAKSSNHNNKFNARKVRYHGGPVQQQQQQPLHKTQSQSRQKHQDSNHDDNNNNNNNEEEEEDSSSDSEPETELSHSFMDICQLASLILAPELVQLEREYNSNSNNTTTTAQQPTQDNNNNNNNNPLALMQLVLDVLVEELAIVTPPDELHKIVETSLLKKQNSVMDETNQPNSDTQPAAAASSTTTTSSSIPHGSILLNRSVLTRLFRAVGEDPGHWTREDLDEMLQLAASEETTTSSIGETTVPLNAAALLRALTSDVRLYPVERTESYSTHYDDVMYTVQDQEEKRQRKLSQDVENNSKALSVKETTEEKIEKGRNTSHRIPALLEVSMLRDTLRPPLTLGTSNERIFTLASLDQAADTQKSLVWICVSWLTLVATAFAYLVGSYEDEFDYQTNLPNLDCSSPGDYSVSEFGCKILNGILLWVQVFIEISIVGGTFLVLSQLGNNVYSGDRSVWITVLYSLVGILTVTFVCILSYFYEVDTFFFDTHGERNVIHVATLFLGTVLIILQTMELLRLLVPHEKMSSRFEWICACDAFKREQSTKHAASFKAGRMLTDAVGCFLGDKFDQHDEVEEEDSVMRSSAHSRPENGMEYDDEEKEIFRDIHAPLVKRLASLVHAIDDRRRKDAASGIVKRSGGFHAGAFVYYHDHMDETVMIGSLSHFWGNLFGSRSMIREEGLWLSARLITANAAQWIVAIFVIPGLFYAFHRLNDENEDVNELQEEEGIEESDAIPGIFVGGVAALLVTWLTALMYVPMAMSTILQMRSGYLGNFFDQRFQLFRKSTDRATALFGSALWGSLFSAALAWGIVGGLIFVFLWEDIRDEVLNFTAGAIGFATTFSIKWLALKVFRRFYFGGLYRRKPAAANIFHLILECWNIALSSGFMLLRIVRLLLTAVFYIGRMDTPFLAEGVGVIFNSPLDSYPMAFRRDLAVHEAHRHPWIERLGTMYMMKLQHGSKFGKRGGAAWRMIFIFALLPWLRKHRQMAPLCFDDTEESDNVLDGDVEDDMYGRETPEKRRQSVMMQKRRRTIVSNQPTSQLLAENESLVAKNLALQRQVMELRSLLGQERRKGANQVRAARRMSVSSPSFPPPLSRKGLGSVRQSTVG